MQLDRERNVLLRLKHPSIVNLLKVVEDNKRNKCYMIFEYVNGGELFDFIVKNGRLSEEDARRFMRDIISAVEYCHSFLIIHRDLKPENLLLDENLNIKITDFGLSNIMEPGKKFSTFCGSLHYACPEILKGEAYIGPGVDIWSMGIILFCLVVGRQPWDGSSADELMRAILEDGLEIPEGISDDCVHFILSMLRVKESDRIPIAEMRYHPWVIEGYGTPPPSFLPPVAPIPEIDEEIFEQMREMGFILEEDEEEIRIGLIRGTGQNQLFCIYNILSQQKCDKAEKQPQPAPQVERLQNSIGRLRSLSVSDCPPTEELDRSDTSSMTKSQTNPAPPSNPAQPVTDPRKRRNPTRTKLYDAECLAQNKGPGRTSKDKDSPQKQDRPILNLEDIACGKIKKTPKTPTRKPRNHQEKPNLVDIFQTSETATKTEPKSEPKPEEAQPEQTKKIRKHPKSVSPNNNLTQMSSLPLDLSPPESKTEKSVDTESNNSFSPQYLTTLAELEVIAELERTLQRLNCRYKMKSKLSIKCTCVNEGEKFHFYVEVLTIVEDPNHPVRGIRIKRLGGNGFAYTAICERLRPELKKFCQENGAINT
eukprot:TRINITY_DN11448_c0_g1_i1.p1 TRINITY_DN11448_c0_g1~~TRINITY_DN11448_c0_g1_i1.p1  ORF type:complete len:650 (+),score=91.75 TRINITY_DN11448_c0_g1_i1:174-1952(+)